MKTCSAGVMFLLLAVLTAAGQSSIAVSNIPAPASIAVQEKNDGKEPMNEYRRAGEAVVERAGRRFAVRMPSNPTTGYSWRLAKPLDGKVVALVTNEYIRPESRLMGAGGYEVWIFQAVGSGETQIALQYVRPWEINQPPAGTNVFTVIVK